MPRPWASPRASPPAGYEVSPEASIRKATHAWYEQLRNPSLRVAAAAGVATHLPGLLYLLGLNAIADGAPPLVEGLLAVLVFDAIWLAIPFCALVVSIRRPEAARAAIGRVSAWMLSHERAGLTLVFSVVGAYFTTRGSLDLLS